MTDQALLNDATQHTPAHVINEADEVSTSTLTLDSSCVCLWSGCPRIMYLQESSSFSYLLCDATFPSFKPSHRGTCTGQSLSLLYHHERALLARNRLPCKPCSVISVTREKLVGSCQPEIFGWERLGCQIYKLNMLVLISKFSKELQTVVEDPSCPNSSHVGLTLLFLTLPMIRSNPCASQRALCKYG